MVYRSLATEDEDARHLMRLIDRASNSVRWNFAAIALLLLLQEEEMWDSCQH